MNVREFPNVEVDKLPKLLPSKNPFTIGALGIPLVNPYIELVSSMIASVENSGKLLGGTIDLYVQGANNICSYKISEDEGLQVMSNEFNRKNLVYAVVLASKDPLKAEKVIAKGDEMREFLGNHDFIYDEDGVRDRTLFVPSPHFMGCAFNVDYEIKDLENMIDFE